MSAKLNINTRVRRLIHYIADLENGLLQIPEFQRDFIWTKKSKLDLLDSLKRGYPIGSILLWKPESSKTHVSSKNIGPFTVPDIQNENFFYILDGFQRLSTILGCLIDPVKNKLEYDVNDWQKNYFICYDLETEEFIIPRINYYTHQVPVHQLLDTRAAFLLEKELQKNAYSPQQIDCYIDRYTELATTLIDYSLPSIDINGGEIEEVVEIFSRVNSKGAEISSDWMASALTYDKNSNFRLGTIIDNLLEELKVYNFSEIKREIILQCIINSFGKIYFDQSKIEDLIKAKKDEFIVNTSKTVENIKKAVRFLFTELFVLDAKLLPYGIQLVFVTDFFDKIPEPTVYELNKLKEWFWITGYSNYFTMYSLSQQRKAYDQFQQFLANTQLDPVYNDKPDQPFEVNEFPAKIYFGSVRAKTLVLFLIKYFVEVNNINPDTIANFNLNYLFFDLRDSKGNFYPESAVVIPELSNQIRLKTKDMSHLFYQDIFDSFDLLDSFSETSHSTLEIERKYQACFITKNMCELYASKQLDYRNEILVERKALILQAEKMFVEELKIVYNA